MGITIAWWSGGVTSAVACKLALDLWDRVQIVMIDTGNEDDDTYRFKADCEQWYGQEIRVIRNEDYGSIQDVWLKHKSLNVANGAICSSELKRKVRERYQKTVDFDRQVFGFDIDEPKRAKSMTLNHPTAKPCYPLLLMGWSKKKCIEIIQTEGIDIPLMYQLGFHNNNCFGTGCVQGGIGYWKKMQREFPEKFEAMAEMEHKLTAMRGFPVTMLKDQSRDGDLVFLKPHPEYPLHKDLSMMTGREVEPLVECNGFCGTYDLQTKTNQP